MRMHNDEMGEYEMTNHVVEYELNRRIGWEPVLSAASRAEDASDIGNRAGHLWAFELAPDGPDATVVTENLRLLPSTGMAAKGNRRWTELDSSHDDHVAAARRAVRQKRDRELSPAERAVP